MKRVFSFKVNSKQRRSSFFPRDYTLRGKDYCARTLQRPRFFIATVINDLALSALSWIPFPLAMRLILCVHLLYIATTAQTRNDPLITSSIFRQGKQQVHSQKVQEVI